MKESRSLELLPRRLAASRARRFLKKRKTSVGVDSLKSTGAPLEPRVLQQTCRATKVATARTVCQNAQVHVQPQPHGCHRSQLQQRSSSLEMQRMSVRGSGLWPVERGHVRNGENACVALADTGECTFLLCDHPPDEVKTAKEHSDDVRSHRKRSFLRRGATDEAATYHG